MFASLATISLRSTEVVSPIYSPPRLFAALSRMCLIQRGAGSRGTWLALGAWLGLAYLAKAVMLPVAVIALAGLAWQHRVTPQRVGLAALSLAVVAGPLIIALSAEKHRFTFSEVASRLRLDVAAIRSTCRRAASGRWSTCTRRGGPSSIRPYTNSRRHCASPIPCSTIRATGTTVRAFGSMRGCNFA